MLVGSGAALVCIAAASTAGAASRPRRGSRQDRGAIAPAASPGTCMDTANAARKEGRKKKRKVFAESLLFLNRTLNLDILIFALTDPNFKGCDRAIRN